jgi:putative FmdB family regulatory protein
MPLYEYRCDACQHVFEVIQKFSDAPIAVCPVCGLGPVEKLPSSPAIQFKGTGWYITDYAKKSSADGGQTGSNTAGGSEKSEKSDKAEKSDKGESKSDAKADAKSDSSTSSSTQPAAKPSKTESS